MNTGLWALLTEGNNKDTNTTYRAADGTRVRFPGLPTIPGDAQAQLDMCQALAETDTTKQKVTGARAKIGDDTQSMTAQRTYGQIGAALRKRYEALGFVKALPKKRKASKPTSAKRKPTSAKKETAKKASAAEQRMNAPAPEVSANGHK